MTPLSSLDRNVSHVMKPRTFSEIRSKKLRPKRGPKACYTAKLSMFWGLFYDFVGIWTVNRRLVVCVENDKLETVWKEVT
jgi:hypothetical protein